jgi:hypothetical protein
MADVCVVPEVYDPRMASERPEPKSKAWFARDARLNDAVAQERLAADWRRTREERLEMTLQLSALLIELGQAAKADEPGRA